MTSIVYDGKYLVTDTLGIVGSPEHHVALSKSVKKIHTYGTKFHDILDDEFEVRVIVGLAGQQSNVRHVLNMVKKTLRFGVLVENQVFFQRDTKLDHCWSPEPIAPEQTDALKLNDALVLVRISSERLNKNMMFVMANGELVEMDEPCWAIGYSYAYFIMGLRLGHPADELMANIAGKYDGTGGQFVVHDIEHEFRNIELEVFPRNPVLPEPPPLRTEPGYPPMFAGTTRLWGKIRSLFN